MFDKIQHPKTGKWHKTTSVMGSKLVERYSKKLNLTGGAINMTPGQDVWFYLNEINEEYIFLLSQLKHYISDPLGNKDAIRAINNSGGDVIAFEARLSDINGPFGATFNAYSTGTAPPDALARMKQALDTIHVNKVALTEALSHANQLGEHQMALAQQQYTFGQQPSSSQSAFDAVTSSTTPEPTLPAIPEREWDQDRFDRTVAEGAALQKKVSDQYWDSQQTDRHKMTPAGRDEVNIHEDTLASLMQKYQGESEGPLLDAIRQSKAKAKARFPSYRFSWM